MRRRKSRRRGRSPSRRRRRDGGGRAGSCQVQPARAQRQRRGAGAGLDHERLFGAGQAGEIEQGRHRAPIGRGRQIDREAHASADLARSVSVEADTAAVAPVRALQSQPIRPRPGHQNSTTARIDLPSCIRSKASLMSLERQLVGDQIVDVDLAVHVPVDDLRHVGAAARAAEGGALPDAAGDELERPRRDLLARRRRRR